MELIDDAGRVGGTPLVIRINPDHFSAINVQGTAATYFGLRFTHTGASPAMMTHRVSYAVTSQSHPLASHHASGFKVL